MLRSYRAVALAALLSACTSATPAPTAAPPAAQPTGGAPTATSPSTAQQTPIANPNAAQAGSSGAAGNIATAGRADASSAGSAPVAPTTTGGANATVDVTPTAVPSDAHKACKAMVAAAKDFLTSVDNASLKSAVLLPFDRRHNYAYEPQVADRPGVSLMMMSDAQRQKALALVHSGLSDRGFMQAETVRQLENLKAVTMFQVNMRDPSYYWLAIFGDPSETGDWAWQWEGHHVALHFTMRACEVADAPLFLGAWPSEVSTMATGAPPIGTRPLAMEEDLGRALATSLNADPQKKMQAIVTSAFREMFPEGPDKQTPLTPAGIAATALSDGEQKQLHAIIEQYAGALADDLKAARLKRIDDHGGFAKVTFVWSGALEPKQRHYYRIQGESFMIEYRNDDGNHIHSVFRDFTGEFGDDLPAPKSP